MGTNTIAAVTREQPTGGYLSGRPIARQRAEAPREHRQVLRCEQDGCHLDLYREGKVVKSAVAEHRKLDAIHSGRDDKLTSNVINEKKCINGTHNGAR